MLNYQPKRVSKKQLCLVVFHSTAGLIQQVGLPSSHSTAGWFRNEFATDPFKPTVADAKERLPA